ncbi:MAG: lipid-A-disaccharide synthase [Elusimicrobia bacterium]|nr:lipid-A-disaccharide synthase [Candidatus Obscuribacterium magneticum]
MKRALIVAGDPSGDIIASQLVQSMKKLEPGLSVVGLGGENLKRVSDHFLVNIVSQHALGFAITPRQIFYFRRILNEVLIPELKKNPPDVVIPVDFYGFNSRVAKIAKKMGHKVFYYVSPQFWASRPYRAENLRPYVDLFLCLFPFELDFYNERGLPAQFVGHPIIDRLPLISQDTHKEPGSAPLIGLLPGSRPEEIRRHLPLMTSASAIVAASYPRARFILFTVPHVSPAYYLKILRTENGKNIPLELVQDENFQRRAQLDLAITASGMETLENTLLGIPMVVMYKTNWVTYGVARLLIRIPFLAMPNLLSGKRIVPELIQLGATPRAIAAPLLQWLKDPASYRALRQELLSLRGRMGAIGATDRAARTILEQVA